jgi:hypothetical protein
MHGINTLSRTALVSIPNLLAIGTMRLGRLKTSLKKQFGDDRDKYKLLRESAQQITNEIPKIQCSLSVNVGNLPIPPMHVDWKLHFVLGLQVTMLCIKKIIAASLTMF